MPLPPGLDPITAGRCAFWLLGKRNQHKAAKRRVSGSCDYGTGLGGRVFALLMPWTIEEYPGGRRFISELCGVAVKTAEDWFYRDKLPPKHAATLAALCRSRAEQFAALADELEVRAREKPRLIVGKAKAQRERRLLRDV